MHDIAFKADFSELEKLTRLYPDISRDVREAKATEVLMLLEAEVKKRTPYGAGPIHLRDTIHTKVSMVGKKVHGIMGTPLEHGEVVEHGRRAGQGFPPRGPIEFWVEKRLGLSGKELRSVAFLIARKIATKGTDGAKMFGDALDENQARAMAILAEIPAEIVRRAEGLA